MPEPLTASEIKARLKSLNGWKYECKSATGTFEFDKFMEGTAFVNRVAEVTEEQEHSPDIVRYTTVRSPIETHPERRVTEWDLVLGIAIERMM